MPELYWAGRHDGLDWIAIEAVPTPLPRSRWEGDPGVMAVLVRLHGSQLDLRQLGGDRPERSQLDMGQLDSSRPDWAWGDGGLFHPDWTSEMTAVALSCVAAEHAGAVRSTLQRAMEQSQALFAPACWISGDPNPTNWGLRGDGSVVLFDWERFGRGTPAIDVAITIPGLPTGDGQAERLVAARYLEQWTLAHGEPLVPLDDFTRSVRLAKLWTIAEFLCSYAEGRLSEGAGSTAAWAADWLPQVADWSGV